MDGRVLIIGAGPAGLGCGLKLEESGRGDWLIYEKKPGVGGLSASFTDENGFVWDLGGHVLFSGNARFNRLFDELMDGDYLEHQREAWIRHGGRWIPYPFQNNIQSLPARELADCVRGLVAARRRGDSRDIDNFRDWIDVTFGEGIARRFMHPYNRKVWAYPLENMSKEWIAERVSVPGLGRILKNALLRAPDAGWGPNNVFRFPGRGGTGEIFRRMAERMEGKVVLGNGVVSIDPRTRTVRTSDGAEDSYDVIVNTSPLDEVVPMIAGAPEEARNAALGLKSNSVIVVGVGLEKPGASTRCWMYSADPAVPFYRVTNFSHYSPNNVPGGDVGRYSSLMCEIAYRGDGMSAEYAVERTLRGLRATGLMERGDEPASLYTTVLEKAYPIPTRDRNARLSAVQEYLSGLGIHSIGRFGAWRYEEGNMDHSVMMGFRAAEALTGETG